MDKDMLLRLEISPLIVGVNLKDARLARGLSVDEAADCIGVMSAHAVYRYEEGRNYPTAEKLLRLMLLYGASAAQLVSPPGENPPFWQRGYQDGNG